MIKVQVQEVIRAGPDDILDLVMDIEQYAQQVDDKIRPVLWVRREQNRVEFACRPRIAGLRQPKVVQFVELTPGRRIDIGLLPKPLNRLAHAVARFEASFECEPSAGGTLVTRTLQFTFSRVARPFVEPLFRRRLEREVVEEIQRAKRYLESC
ncbi:SRPBCC family protein [Kribbella italica]|uniref:Ribosome-associated toxin RatA of RatAB toxin-antitoxin module n=1 Tax=Kribbella italica TaxID=1540520 RepID=A0A7W9MVN9_9ACTN|nr:ribosome-associated toxin RatA of RatAB toxin-antitoxin module [Kribbella italica]